MGPKPPPPKGGGGKRIRKGRRDDDEYGGYMRREQQLMKPADQEKLTESQMKEEISRVLVTTDPTVMHDRVIWDYTNKAYTVVPVVNETITLLHIDSELVSKDQLEEFKKTYPYPLTDEVEDPEWKEEPKQVAAPPAPTTPRTSVTPAPHRTSGASGAAAPSHGRPSAGAAPPRTSATPAPPRTSGTPAPPRTSHASTAAGEHPHAAHAGAAVDHPHSPHAGADHPHSGEEVPQEEGQEKSPEEHRASIDGEAGEAVEGEGEEKKAEAKPEEEEEEEPKEVTRQTKFLNQFDYSDRSTQTYNNPLREHGCQTQPPPRSSYKDYCNAWIIYDAYENDTENKPKAKRQGDENEDNLLGPDADHLAAAIEGDEDAQQAREEEKQNKDKKEEGDPDKEGKFHERERVKMRKASVLEGQAAQEAALNKSAEGLKILERLVMHNVHNEVLFDFKYYEDASDEFRETGEGTILPLWKFAYDRAKRLHVTGISWSQSEPDMFAVSYGSFSFTHPINDGMVLIWSLRNPAFPEQIWVSPRGCMCCAVHPTASCLVAVGMYDGNVAMIQLQPDEDNATSSVVLKNVHVIQKHRSPIWSVKWGEDDMDGDPNFYSCGLDGRIIHWVIDTSDSNGVGGLGGTEICTLHLPVPPVTGPDGTTYKLFGCARVLAFHPKEKTTFLVGTAEGNIFRCSSLYGSRFQQIYNAHFLPVAALEWNYYHKDVFISCSEDWTIKIWDKKDPEPMYIFEIGVAIMDCCWAPYSSTVFAAVTEEGKALVYDLNVNKEKPICCQQIVTKKKVRPHRIQFNPYYPILCVGDDRGQLTTLKLSPNLRILPKDSRGMNVDGEAKVSFEIGKMTKLLSLVRDPVSITNPKSLARPDEKQVQIVLSAMAKK